MGNSTDKGLGELIGRFLDAHDFAAETRRAMGSDLRKFVAWFASANAERFDPRRVTTGDITAFREHLRKQRRQAVATVNRNLNTLRRFLGWLRAEGVTTTNPAEAVRELREVRLSPKGLERAQVRRLLREAELRNDLRANAIFSFLLYSGARVSDLANVELGDLHIGPRSGRVRFRDGKGGKERTVPLPLAARSPLAAYFAVRPPTDFPNVFLGERGPLTTRGVRNLFRKYSSLIGVPVHPHLLRHTFAKAYLNAASNDLSGLALLLGHNSLNTTARYAQKSSDQLAEAVEQVTY